MGGGERREREEGDWCDPQTAGGSVWRMGGERVVPASLRKERHRGKRQAAGLEKGCVWGTICFTLKSVTLQISNKFTKLVKCLLKETFLNGLVGTG